MSVIFLGEREGSFLPMIPLMQLVPDPANGAAWRILLLLVASPPYGEFSRLRNGLSTDIR